MTKTNFLQSGKIKSSKGKTTCSYKKGEYISLEDGELKIMNKKIGKHLETAGKEANKKQREVIEQADLLESQLKKFRDNIYGKDDALFDRNGNNVSRQVENELTNFYHEIRKAQRKEIIEMIKDMPENFPELESDTYDEAYQDAKAYLLDKLIK